MPKFSISRLRQEFSKEKGQERAEKRLTKQLNKERSKYERYAAVSAQDERLRKLKAEIKSYKEMRKKTRMRKVRIGGHTFKI